MVRLEKMAKLVEVHGVEKVVVEGMAVYIMEIGATCYMAMVITEEEEREDKVEAGGHLEVNQVKMVKMAAIMEAARVEKGEVVDVLSIRRSL